MTNDEFLMSNQLAIKMLTIKSARQLLDRKEISAQELQGEFLKLIRKENPELNAYLSVFENKNHELGIGNRGGALLGIPCIIKDNILIQGQRCTAGSKILENYIAPYGQGQHG